MANSFGQYTGGIQGVQGISEAGANIGRFMQIGLENAGTGIAEGLKAYNENVSKDAILTEQLKGMGQQVLQYHDMFSNNPELRGLADQMQPVLDQFQKAPSMSMSQKQGLLLSGQATLANVVPSYQMQSAMNDANTKRKIADYDAEIGTYTKNPTAQAAMKEIKSTYNPNISPEQNTANESAEYDKWVASTGKEGLALDRQEYLSAWNKKWARNITDNKELQNKKPDLYNRLVEGFKGQEGYEQNIQTDNSGVTDYSKESDLYNATTTSAVDIINNNLMAKGETPSAISDIAPPKVAEPSAEIIAALAVNRKKDDEVSAALTKLYNAGRKNDPETKALEEGKALYAERQKLTASQTANTGSIAQKLSEHNINSKENIKTLENKKIELIAKQKEEEKSSYFNKSSPIERTAENIGELVRQYGLSLSEKYSKVDAKTGDVSIDMGKVGKKLLEVGYPTASTPFTILNSLGAFDNKSQYEKDVIKSEIATQEIAKGTAPLKTQIELVDNALEAQKRIAGGIAKAIEPENIKKSAPMEEVAYQPSSKEDTYLHIGTAYRPERVKIEQKKQQMVDWFKETQGYVPANFDDFFNKTHPEASLQYATTPTGSTVMFTDGKWVELKSDTKNQMTPEQQKVYEGRIKGSVNKDTGLLDFEEVGVNTGISLKGIATGSETAVSEFNTLTTQAGTALTNINKLLGMIDKDGKSIMPTMRVEGQRISKFLAANLRPIVYHGARAAAWEEGSLGELATDPTKFWSLDSVNRKSLETVRQAVIDSLKMAAKDHKVEVQVNDASSKEDMKNSVLAMKLAARKTTN